MDTSWTLFIDRDGVVNEEKPESYINHWDEFYFYPGAKDAFRVFSGLFGRIIMVTNQRGVARGFTLPENLALIHSNMLREIEKAGGRIDRIYFCPDLESVNRKPNPGMAMQAFEDFPDIDPQKSVMIGNTLSDMQFGRNAGIALNIFLPTTRPEVNLNDPLIDLVFSDLHSVAEALREIR